MLKPPLLYILTDTILPTYPLVSESFYFVILFYFEFFLL